MTDLIDRSALLSYIDDEIEFSKEELEDAKARGHDRDRAYNNGEIQAYRRMKRYISREAPSVEEIKKALRAVSEICAQHQFCADCPLSVGGKCPTWNENGEPTDYPENWVLDRRGAADAL